MSAAALNFLRLRAWYAAAVADGRAGDYMLRMEARLAFEAQGLIAWFVSPEGTP